MGVPQNYSRVLGEGLLLPDSVTKSIITTGGATATYDTGWSGPGTIADGDDVTFTKAAGGMAWPTDPRPRVWIPGEANFLLSSTYSRDSTVYTARSNAFIDTTHKVTNAAGSIAQPFPVPASDANYFSNVPQWAFSTETVFVSLHRMHNFVPSNPPHHNDKSFRLWPVNTSGTPDYYVLIESGFCATICEGYNTNPNDFMASGSRFMSVDMPIVANTWYHDEYYCQFGTTDTYDGIAYFYRNAGRARNESVKVKYKTSSGEPGQLAMIWGFLDQFSNQFESDGVTPTAIFDPGLGLRENISHLYIDDKIQNIYMSTETSWTQQSFVGGGLDPDFFREQQLPIAGSGSDTSIGVHIRQGSFSSLPGHGIWFRPPNAGAAQRICRLT